MLSTQRWRRVRGAERLLLGLGDKTWGAAFLDAALVLLVVAAGLPGAVVGFARFLGTFSSSFSLSPSSDGRFLPRAILGTGLGAGLAGTARVLRATAVVAAGARIGAVVVPSAISFLAGNFAVAGMDASRRSMSFILRLLLGMRLMRRSRRDRRLATCASHMATSFSLRALTATVSKRL